MSDHTGYIPGEDNIINLIPQQRCRVSYTLNNDQPVCCTIIGDAPLFYMDIEEDLEGMEILDFTSEDMLEDEIEILRSEMKALDKFSSSFGKDEELLFDDLLNNSLDLAAPCAEDMQDYSFQISRLKKSLAESRTAKAFLDFAESHKITITYSTNCEYSVYDRKNGAILIHPYNSFADQILLAIKELRTHWQHRQGALINPLNFHPDNAVLVNRAQIADLCVAMIRCAWELQLSGFKDAWERIENSSLSDLGRAFAREAFLDFRTINNGIAGAAVFETWFLSERCQSVDKFLVQNMLADHQGIVFDAAQMSAALTPELIGALGSYPFGKNYLAQHAATIMSDPIFTDIRDRSNANFLWFIKFERSFRETEQALHLSPDHSAGSSDTGISQNFWGQDYATQQSAQIIQLFPEHGSGNKSDRKAGLGQLFKSKKGKEQGHSADIVYLQRWSGD